MKNKGGLRKGSILIVAGLLLIAAALFLMIFNLYDGQRAERSAQQVLEQMDPPDGQTLLEGEIPDYILNPDMDMPVETIDGRDYIGTLQIPSLNLTLPVMSQWNYDNLQIAPCRYTGSVYKDDMIIAAHNYPSHFGNLKHLQEGEQVLFTDVNGNVFTYTVVVRETLMPAAVEDMKSKENGSWDLTLFTCTIGGQSRVTVRCVREDTAK